MNRSSAKVFVIIQARMGSTRLPGKVMKKLFSKSILEHDIERVRKAKNFDKIIIATTTKKADDAIAKETKKLGLNCFRGSEDNVLERYYLAAKESGADIIVRITSDCPLYDPALLDEMIAEFKSSDCDYLSNCLVRTYPRGLDTEIFTFEALKRVYDQADDEVSKEHVTPYINGNPSIFKLQDFVAKNDNSHLRWTLDTQEDFDFIQAVYNELYEKEKIFTTEDILNLLGRKPQLSEINSHIEQKKVAT